MRDDKDDERIAALLAEPNVSAAAARAGVSEATIYRRLAEPEFRTAHRAARRNLIDATTARLTQIAGEAVDALRRGLTCGVPGVEVRAAQAILSQVQDGTESLDFDERLNELES